MPFAPAEQATFEGLYKQALTCDKAADESKIVQLFDKMLALLVEAGEADTMELHPKLVGVHPKNRSGKLMVPSKVHNKGLKISKVGFSWKLCGPDKAVAFENNPKSNHIEKATLEFSKSSPELANYSAGSVKAGSVGCGHLNQFLACVYDGVRTGERSLCEHGRNTINKHFLCERDAELKKAVEKGLRWTVVNFRIEELYPNLPDIFQRALNVEHHIGEGCRFIF